MLLRSLRYNTKILHTKKRNYGSLKEKLVTVELNDQTGIAIINLNRPPVNALNLELLQNLKKTIKNLNDKCLGVILTSSNSSIFSSGLDIKELYKPDPERLKQFYATFQDTWLALFGCDLPTAVVINGHSPAGGCAFATCCDLRVMMPNFTIGLNETQLGLVPPKYLVTAFCNILAKRPAELALTQGKMFTTEEALKVGLIDEVVESKEEGLIKCEQFLQNFKGVHSTARTLTKLQFRERDIHEFQKEKYVDLNLFAKRVLEPNTQEQLRKYIENLKNKKKKIKYIINN